MHERRDWSRNAVGLYHRAARYSYSANFELGEMYRWGEGTSVNHKQAIRYFLSVRGTKTDESNWNLAQIYEIAPGFKNTDRAVNHYRIAADLGHPQAREVVGGYFVRGTPPRKLSVTEGERATIMREIRKAVAEKEAAASQTISRKLLMISGPLVICAVLRPDWSCKVAYQVKRDYMKTRRLLN